MDTATYRVEGMTCGGCARSVTEAIHRVSPALMVEVNVEAGQVRIKGEHDEARLREAVEAAGFDFAGRLPAA